MNWLARLLAHRKGILGIEEIRLVVVASTTVLQGAVTLIEIMVDLPTVRIDFVVPFLFMNVLLLWACFRYQPTPWVAHIQMILMYAHGCLILVTNPKDFHTIVFFVSMVPISALIMLGLSSAKMWFGYILVYIIGFGSYFQVMHSGYVIAVSYASYMILGVFFSAMLMAWVVIMKNVFGFSIDAAMMKNKRISSLLRQVEYMNSKLELKVAQRTKDLEERNRRLEEYAFMNSHLVRAPLANILGLVSHLKNNTTDRKKDELIELIDISSQKLDDEIKNIASRLAESGHGRYN